MFIFTSNASAVYYSFDSINHWSNAKLSAEGGKLHFSGTAGSMHDTPYGTFIYSQSSGSWTRVSSIFNDDEHPPTTNYRLEVNTEARKLVLYASGDNKKISEHTIEYQAFFDDPFQYDNQLSPVIDYEDDKVIWFTLNNYYADGNDPIANGVIHLPTMKWYEVKTRGSSFTDIYRDGHTYWAGTAAYSDFGGAGDGGGLFSFSLKTKKIMPAKNINELLPNKGILSVIKYNGDLWLATIYGLIRINYEKKVKECFAIRRATLRKSIKKTDVNGYLPNEMGKMLPVGKVKTTKPMLKIYGTNAEWEKKYFYLVELSEKAFFWTAKNKKITYENKEFYYSTDYTQYGYRLFFSPDLKGVEYFLSYNTVGVHKLLAKEGTKDKVRMELPFAYIKAENIDPVLEPISCEALTSYDIR